MPKKKTVAKFRTKRQKKVRTLCCLIGLGSVFLLGGFIMVSSPINITFNVNPIDTQYYEENYVGETVKPIRSAGSGSLELPAPVRPQYRFLGWSEKSQGGKIVTRATKRKMNLYAQWAPFVPTASLYVDGQYLRDAEFTSWRGTGGSGLGNGKPGEDQDPFIPQLEWNREILGAYMANNNFQTSPSDTQFFGWYYNDENNHRVELRYFHDGGSVPWRIYKIGPTSQTANQITTDHPFELKNDVALNAIFNTATSAQKANFAYNHQTVADYHFGRTIRIRYTSGDNAYFFAGNNQPDPVNVRFGRTMTFPGNVANNYNRTAITGHYLIGWKLEDDSDIFKGFTYTAGTAYAAQFFLDPTLAKFIKNDELVMTAIATPTNPQGQVPANVSSRTYQKYIDDDGIVRIERTNVPASSEPIQITDLTTRTEMDQRQIEFNFEGAYGNKLRNATSLLAGGTYDTFGTGYTTIRRTVSSNAKLILPTVENYAVGGRIFDGWRMYLNGKPTDNLYPAGLEYNIPRGMNNINNRITLSFVAEWSDMRRLASFDTNGGTGNIKTENFFGIPGDTKRLPTLTRWGYDFVGWNDQLGNVLYAPNTPEWNGFKLTNKEQKLVAVFSARAIPNIQTIVPNPLPPPLDNFLVTPADGKWVWSEPTSYRFGDTMILSRFEDSTGWRFQRGTRTGANDWDSYYFGAPFIRTVRVKITEKFVKDHIGSSNWETFVNRSGNIVARSI